MKKFIQASLIVAALFAASTSCLAVVIGSDDFDDNFASPLKWGPDFGSGPALLTETNQRLEYTAPNTGTQIFSVRPWIFNTLPYNASWEVQADVHVGAVDSALLPSHSDDVRFSLGVLAGLGDAGIQLEVENYDGTVLRSFTFVNEGPGGPHPEPMALTGSTDGALRIAFDSLTKVLGFYYDDNGAIGGYSWSLLGSIDTDAAGSDWGLTGSSTFTTGLGGESTGFAVASGQAYGDNFIVSAEQAPVPEPGTLGLFLIGVLGLAGFAARRKRCRGDLMKE